MIRLNQHEIRFLLNLPDLPSRLAKTLTQADIRHEGLSEDNADAFRDLCGERLQTHGFGPDYEPTAEGKMLEGLIDRLVAECYSGRTPC